MRLRDDDGSAVIEFVFVAIVFLVPLVYLIAAVASVQRTQLAVQEAARDAGRAYATSATTGEAERRARAAVRLALDAQGLPDEASLRFVPAGGDCGKPPTTPSLAPGAEFTVCVTRHADLPGVPSLLSGRGITTTGAFVVHVDDYRAAP